jgi:hypothetical protein
VVKKCGSANKEIACRFLSMVKFNKKLCSTDEVMQHANQEAQIVFPFGRVLDVLVVFLFPMCSHQVF